MTQAQRTALTVAGLLVLVGAVVYLVARAGAVPPAGGREGGESPAPSPLELEQPAPVELEAPAPALAVAAVAVQAPPSTHSHKRLRRHPELRAAVL